MMEIAILDFIRENLVCEPITPIMKVITFLGNAGWFWILIGVALLIPKRTRAIGVSVCIALIFSLIFCNLTLKPIVARTRPYDIVEGLELLISRPSDFSFPSGHSSASFAAAVAILMQNRKYGLCAIITASLIAFSRLYFYVHFPSDVLAGIILGSACGVAAHYVTKFIKKKTSLV